jgi:quinoprotein glucose dehydrogenase
MFRRCFRTGIWTLTCGLGCLISIGAQPAEQDRPQWRAFAADLASTKYSPLDQITKTNVKDLKIAWRWKSDNLGSHPDYNFQATPLIAGGVLYTTAGSRRDVVAIDAATGETLWIYRLDEGTRGARAPLRSASGRGVAYWTDGTDERIFHVTQGYHLVALNAKTGVPVHTFGKNGIVDLFQELDGNGIPPEGVIGWNSPALVVKDVVVIGAAFGLDSLKHQFVGHIRAYDVRTGKRRWIFHTVPKRDEPGSETWENGSLEYAGNTGAWAPMSADEQLGYVYVPTETPTADLSGQHRPGNNLFADSLVCLDASTGKRVWHFQIVHHGLWDYDNPTQPILLDITVNGRKIKAVVQLTKQAFAYVFDRVTGQPVWPIEERSVPVSDIPGEKSSPTQPFPTKPAPFDRQGISQDDVIDFTPELKAEALKVLSRYRIGPLFTPPSIASPNGTAGTLMLPGTIGGANWQGGAADPETGIVYVESLSAPRVAALRECEAGSSAIPAMRYCPGGSREMYPEVQGIPIVKPPWGRITAIDLNTGDHVWTMANADTPDRIRTNPALKGITIPRTGHQERGGLMVTKTLLFAGEGAGLFSVPHNDGGRMLRAHDKRTGEIISEFELPARQTGGPMTYMINGKQYIVVAIGAQNQPAELVALTLP